MKKKLLLALPLIALLAGCTDLEEEYSSYTGDIKSVTISLPEINPEVASTRTNISIGSNVKVTWAENDTVGIFPVGGGQVEFPISSAAGTDHASFNGGKWALRGSEKYAAYFPYNKANIYRDSENILLDYTGQKQEGVNSTAHLGSYDFMASPAVTADKYGNLDFELKRFAKIMILRLTFPEPLQVTSIKMKADEPVFISKQILNISGDVPYVDTAEDGLTSEVQLKTELQEPVQSGDFYLMMAMQDLTPYNLRVLVTTADKRFFSSDIVSKNMTDETNYAYLAAAELEDCTEEYIEFEDMWVSSILFDRYGGISYQDAASIDIEDIFASHQELLTFNEFMYFTSSSIRFDYCSRLESIILPEGLSVINDEAFLRCYHLNSINIPSSVTAIGRGAFYACESLTSVILPENLIRIEDSAFADCGFSEIIIPQNVEFLGYQAFCNCDKFTKITLLSTIPPTLGYRDGMDDGDRVFDGSECPIFVPSASVEVYKNEWPQYADRITEMGASGGFGGEGGID